MSRKFRRNKRKKQLKINVKLKKKLFSDVAFAPCCYCRNVFFISQLTIEHLVPLSYGGTNDESNIDLACAPCNQKRGRESWFAKKQIMKNLFN
jgi:5-methylcytosine-specific restriction endonuclease McrA